jgi:hypothetical protein
LNRSVLSGTFDMASTSAAAGTDPRSGEVAVVEGTSNRDGTGVLDERRATGEVPRAGGRATSIAVAPDDALTGDGLAVEATSVDAPISATTSPRDGARPTPWR